MSCTSQSVQCDHKPGVCHCIWSHIIFILSVPLITFTYSTCNCNMEMKRKRKLDDSNEHASMLPPKTSPGLMGNLFKAVHGGSDTSSKVS